MIEQSDIGKRLDVYVSERESLTRSAAQKLSDDGRVLVCGTPRPKNYRLRCGDTVEVIIPEPMPDKAQPENIPLDIVYEDSSFLIVNKPKGMVVHPAAGHESGTLVNALLFHCGSSLSGINGVIRPGIVHRIDRDTSGLLAVAKTDEAHLSLAEQISSHTLERHYHAICIGHLKESIGTVDAPIARHKTDRKRMAVVQGGREAVTHYEVIEPLSVGDYIKLQLKTGRTHQIRVHMSSMGHPILGDTVYGGGRTKWEKSHESLLCGQCLHAKTLCLRHPRSGEIMRFEAELPSYFSEALRLLR